MSAKYQQGKTDALEALGLRPRIKDNPIVSKFVSAIGTDKPANPKDGGGNRMFNRQTWGKRQDYSTSNEEFHGGGIRL